jgi:hypothetical protein
MRRYFCLAAWLGPDTADCQLQLLLILKIPMAAVMIQQSKVAALRSCAVAGRPESVAGVVPALLLLQIVLLLLLWRLDLVLCYLCCGWCQLLLLLLAGGVENSY